MTLPYVIQGRNGTYTVECDHRRFDLLKDLDPTIRKPWVVYEDREPIQRFKRKKDAVDRITSGWI